MATNKTARVLLRTKLSPPRVDGAVERPCLLAAATSPSRRVTLLTAGPGMGKTWLAASIVRTAARCAWVSFESTDAEGFAAWSYIVEALAPFLGDAADEAEELLTASYERDAVERLAACISNALADAADTVIILDDAHALFGTEAWPTILEWFRGAPESLRFIVTSREEPAEYLGDLALHGELTHVDHEGFQLTAAEARAVLASFEGLAVTPDLEERLIASADGWVGALQMLAAAERLAPGGANRAHMTTSYLWQFLAREIVDSLGETERDVLIVAAALPDCEAAVLQTCFPGSDMPSLLASLQRRIPFLGALRSGEETRRIHPLLAAFLRECYAESPERWAPALRRAEAAYEADSRPAAALEIALIRGDEQAILRLTRVVSSTALGAHYLLRIPRACATADPEIAMQRAFIHFARNELAECRYLIEHFPADAPAELAQSIHFLSFMFTPPTASDPVVFVPRFTTPAERSAPRASAAGATRIIMLLRQAMELNGQCRPGPALKAIEQLRSIDGWDGPGGMKFFALIWEAQIREERGELDRCLRLYDEVTAGLAANPDHAHLAAYVHLGRAGIVMKRFLLDEAAALLEQGRPMMDGQPRTLDAGFVINEVELLLCRGEQEKARELLRPLCAAPRLHLVYAHYLLDLDRLGGADAGTKAAYRALCDRENPDGLTSEELMLESRLFPSDPRSADRLDDAIARMRADTNVSLMVDSLLLKASRSSSDRDIALDAIREALHYAVPEGFIMPFVVENELPTSLLRDALADQNRSLGPRDRAFLTRAIHLRTLRSTPAVSVPPAPRGETLLTEREAEVLLHMARGETNAQIAAALFVSLPTVKTHVASILSKLGAARRTEAIELARKRGLLTFPAM